MSSSGAEKLPGSAVSSYKGWQQDALDIRSKVPATAMVRGKSTSWRKKCVIVVCIVGIPESLFHEGARPTHIH